MSVEFVNAIGEEVLCRVGIRMSDADVFSFVRVLYVTQEDGDQMT